MAQCNLILFYIAQCYVSNTSWQLFVVCTWLLTIGCGKCKIDKLFPLLFAHHISLAIGTLAVIHSHYFVISSYILDPTYTQARYSIFILCLRMIGSKLLVFHDYRLQTPVDLNVYYSCQQSCSTWHLYLYSSSTRVEISGTCTWK